MSLRIGGGRYGHFLLQMVCASSPGNPFFNFDLSRLSDIAADHELDDAESEIQTSGRYSGEGISLRHGIRVYDGPAAPLLLVRRMIE
jgi:hypothetical protein